MAKAINIVEAFDATGRKLQFEGTERVKIVFRNQSCFEIKEIRADKLDVGDWVILIGKPRSKWEIAHVRTIATIQVGEIVVTLQDQAEANIPQAAAAELKRRGRANSRG